MLIFLLGAVPILIAGALSAGWVFQKLGSRQDARQFPPSGQFVQTSSGRFHMSITAGPQPVTVVLESGLAGTSLSWVYVQEEVARFACCCSYDRAGFGWSDPARKPRTLRVLVEELREVLTLGPVAGPFILVGHSFGGLIVRAFSHLYPDLVAGMVLVDPVSSGYWASCADPEAKRLKRGARLARRGELLARFGVIRLALNLVIAGRRFLPERLAGMTASGAGQFLRRLAREIQKLPPALWPIVRAQWSRPMGFRTLASYLKALQQSCSEAELLLKDLSVPTVILSASTATEFELEERERWLDHCPSGSHVRLTDSGHWIQIEAPKAVIEAIQSVAAKLPNELPLLPCPPKAGTTEAV